MADRDEIVQQYPSLEPFFLSEVALSGTVIGAGSYSTVEEVVVPVGAAARRLHDMLARKEDAAKAYVKECELMSTLRHPNIIRFLGVCSCPGSRLPALVMERMATNLHDLLEGERASDLSLDQKFSILHDVACGLAYLHERSPPVIHRDLSARNVLLNSEMVAKLADFGAARVVEKIGVAARMTGCPGNLNYMPPEAISQPASYDSSIDVFSFGVLVIFTISGVFPGDLLPATYVNEEYGILMARSELERRAKYVRRLRGSRMVIFHELIQKCLENRPAKRPDIRGVLSLLERARSYSWTGLILMFHRSRVERQLELRDLSPVNRNLDQVVGGLVAENSDLQSRVKKLESELAEARQKLKQKEEEEAKRSGRNFVMEEVECRKASASLTQRRSPSLKVAMKSLSMSDSSTTSRFGLPLARPTTRSLNPVPRPKPIRRLHIAVPPHPVSLEPDEQSRRSCASDESGSSDCSPPTGPPFPIAIEPGKRPTLPQLLSIDLPSRVGDKYMEFGIALIGEDEGKMELVERRFHGDSKGITVLVLRQWLRGRGIEVSWDNLISVLEECNLVELAREVYRFKNMK